MKHYFWLNKEIKIIHGWITVPEIKQHKLIEAHCINSMKVCGFFKYMNHGNGYTFETVDLELLDPEFQVQLMLLGFL